MQRYFKKIKERLENAKGVAFLTLANTGDPMKDVVYDEVMVYMNTAIEIVNQVAEEYGKAHTYAQTAWRGKKNMNNCECDRCELCFSYRKNKRKAFHCEHPDQKYIKDYFREHKIMKMPGFIGFGEKLSDVPVNKTTPKWCPKLKGE